MKLYLSIFLASTLNASDQRMQSDDEVLALAIALSLEDSRMAPVQQIEDDEDLARAFALSLEDSRMVPVQQIEDDEALARALAQEDLDLRHTQPNYFCFVTSQDVETINVVSEKLRSIYVQHGDVHAGDHYIPQQIPSIVNIGHNLIEQCGSDIQSLANEDLLQVSHRLLSIISTHSNVLSGYHYEGTPKSLSDIEGIIKTQFSRSFREVGNYASGQGTQVWAMAIALTSNLLNNPYVANNVKCTIIRHLVDESIEGMMTRGGCIQGFVNRGFIALINVLAYYSRSI
ncbi:MAG: hypothetical protein KF798_07015 [Candidatus Paracaedibacteraceae bacterium]|nr:hypothetical protein [Candidatus Paracaedibacteraceae bacterium]